jgi:hypothetical protein
MPEKSGTDCAAAGVAAAAASIIAKNRSGRTVIIASLEERMASSEW